MDMLLPENHESIERILQGLRDALDYIEGAHVVRAYTVAPASARFRDAPIASCVRMTPVRLSEHVMLLVTGLMRRVAVASGDPWSQSELIRLVNQFDPCVTPRRVEAE